jgi:tetratricopeptide (TPR) repeat protein
MLQAEGRFAEAEPLFRQSNEQLARVLGPQHPYTIDALANYGRFLRRRGDPAAEQVLRDVLARNLSVRGTDHALVGNSRVNLAIELHDAGKLDDAESEFRAALATFESALPRDHPYRAAALAGLGRVLVDRGRAREAEPLLRESLEIAIKALPRSPLLAVMRVSLGSALVQTGAYAEAAPLLRENVASVLETQGAQAAVTRQAQRALQELDRVQAKAASRG